MDQWSLLDGQLRPAAEALVPLDDRGLTLGDGAFTTVAVRGGRPVWLADHLDRLAADLARLGLADPVTPRLRDGSLVRALLQANGMADAAHDAVLRIAATAGSAPRGLPRPAAPGRWWASVSAASLGPRLAPGVRVVSVAAPWLTGLAAAGLTSTKHASRLPWVSARQSAAGAPDVFEVLLTDTKGAVVTAASHNVFWVDAAGRLCTPPVVAGALAGLTRARVLRLAANMLGLTVDQSAPLAPDELVAAREVFLTNSLSLVASVDEVDGRTLAARREVAAAVADALLANE